MQFSNGWVDQARQIVSPNFDERPQGSHPEVFIIHSISLPPGKFSGCGVEHLFTNKLNPDEDPYYRQIQGLRVSCHFFIRRNGELIQFIATDQRAWHCGVSTCFGRESVNDFSIGVELEGMDYSEFEGAQYDCLIALTRGLQIAYPAITNNQIFGHQHIAPERKTDPGSSFEWNYFLTSLDHSHAGVI